MLVAAVLQEWTAMPSWAHRERNIREIFSMYEVSFATLSERFYKNTTWPPVEYIAELVDHDHVFCLLYKARWHGSEHHCVLSRQQAQQQTRLTSSATAPAKLKVQVPRRHVMQCTPSLQNLCCCTACGSPV